MVRCSHPTACRKRVVQNTGTTVHGHPKLNALVRVCVVHHMFESLGSELLLAACMFIGAALYASVGHAGASAYIALMALFSVAPTVMRPTALALNILVAASHRSATCERTCSDGGHCGRSCLAPCRWRSSAARSSYRVRTTNQSLVLWSGAAATMESDF